MYVVGEYRFVLSVTDGYGTASDTVSVFVDEANAISTSEFEKINMFPNPTTGPINFSSTVSEVKVHDLQGRTLLNFSDQGMLDRLNLNTLSNGTYLIQYTYKGIPLTEVILIKE